MSETIYPIDTGKPRWRHHRGGVYRLLYEAADAASGHPVMVYQSEANGRVFVHQRVDFYTCVRVEGQADSVPRFEKLRA
jgi:hypothetical protein